MDKDKDNFQNLWLAVNEPGDWFSRLGGSARYDGFYLSDIPLFLGVTFTTHLLGDKIDIRQTDDFVPRTFIQAAAPILQKVYAYIARISFEDSVEGLKFIKEFIDYSNQKLVPNRYDRSYAWQRFINFINSLSDESKYWQATNS